MGNKISMFRVRPSTWFWLQRKESGQAVDGRSEKSVEDQGIMKTSEKGIYLIKHFEGCKLKAYKCSAKVWTIGWGHTRGVKEGDTCTQEEADQMLVEDLEEFEIAVTNAVKPDVAYGSAGKSPLNQNQFDALVSWTYNLGPTNLHASTLLIRLNEGKFDEAPDEIRRWNRAGGKVVAGLVRRREAEALLFQGKDWK
jgi:lysozyme